MAQEQQRVVTSYRVLVGLEVHVQLATNTKMFTGVANGATNFGAEPNSLVDEQVLGLPGVLPVMNKRAVEHSIKVGLALGCTIARHTKWDRKSYYYPDLPKNYQISQYDLPLCHDGSFALTLKDGVTRSVRIRRAHLEEDAGKLLHEAPGGYSIPHSIVDLNRAGTPLLEIVTEPDLSSGEEVAAFGQELQKLVQFLGVSEGQMQMGHMRFEPNINVHITDAAGQVHKTAITEIKNLNSFSVLQRATDHEVRRQVDQWVRTGSLGRKSTHGWDDAAGATFHQRDKEEANDYRYFPDPDLVPVEVSDEWLTQLKAEIGELPQARRKRFIEVLGLSPVDAIELTSDRGTGDVFQRAVELGGSPKRVANLILSHGRRIANIKKSPLDRLQITPHLFAEVAKLIDAEKIAASAAGAIFDAQERIITVQAHAASHAEASATATRLRAVTAEGKATGSGIVDTSNARSAEDIARSLGLIQTSDTGAIDAAIDAVIAQNPKPLQDVRAGKLAAMGAVVGMIMKTGKGLNPKLVQERLRAKLGI